MMHEGEITLKKTGYNRIISTAPKRTFGLYLPLIMFSTSQQTFGPGRKRKTDGCVNKHCPDGLTEGTASVLAAPLGSA